MNDNSKDKSWETWSSTFLGAGFRVMGILLFVGAICGGIWAPYHWALHVLWILMGIGGFAMVMV